MLRLFLILHPYKMNNFHISCRPKSLIQIIERMFFIIYVTNKHAANTNEYKGFAIYTIF